MSRYHADDVYCYPGTPVLRNKANLTNQSDLDAYEAEITAVRLVQLGENPVNGHFDFDHLKKIHFVIFQDVYDWAGEVRTVDISRDNSRFANVQYIASAAKTLFSELAKENHLKGLDAETLPNRLAHYLSEINALHPFREGNGRAQRAFIAQLCQEAGYQLDYSDFEQDQIYQAMKKAFHGDETVIASLIRQRISKKH